MSSFAYSPEPLNSFKAHLKNETFQGGKDHHKERHLELTAHNSLAWTAAVHWKQQLWYHRLTQETFLKNEPFCTQSLDQKMKSQKHQKAWVKVSLSMLGLSVSPASNHTRPNRGVWAVAFPSMSNFPELPPLGTAPNKGNALKGVIL